MLSQDEAYQLDVNGYLLIKNAIDPDLLEALTPVIDKYEETSCLNAVKTHDKLARIILEHPLFIDIAMTPAVVARVVNCIQFPRIKSTWLDFKGPGGNIGFHSNHTPYDPVDAYYWQGGHIYANLITVCYALGDVPSGGAALQVIPGSHKANYPLPEDPTIRESLLRELPMDKGDALMFSHDMHHGSYNSLDYTRRCLFTSFSTGSSAHTQGDNHMYDEIFEQAPEGSWKKYLFRQPKGDRDSYPQPRHAVMDEQQVLVT